MLVSRTEECPEITANDGCRLRELLHPERGAPGVPYSLAVAFIEPGTSTAPHVLTEEDEVYYFLEGTGSILIEDQAREVRTGDVVLVPAGRVQTVRNTGSARLRWLNIVSPPWRADLHLRSVLNSRLDRSSSLS